MRAYSQDLRDRVIGAYKEGLSLDKIAITFKLSLYAIKDWIKRYEEIGDYSSKQALGLGRPRRFSDKEEVLNFIKNNPDADGIAIRDGVAPALPMSTFYDTLKRMNITLKKRNQNIKKENK
jgi:transposase